MGVGAEDRLDIMELYARHAWAMDSGDLDGFLDVFTPDGSAYGNVGREAITDFLARFLPDSAFPGSQHFAYQWRFLEGDATRRHVRSYVMRLGQLPGTSDAQIIWVLLYDDLAEKCADGRWRFARKAPYEHPSPQLPYDSSKQGVGNRAAWELYDMGPRLVTAAPVAPGPLGGGPRPSTGPRLAGLGGHRPADRLAIMELYARRSWALDAGEPGTSRDRTFTTQYLIAGSGDRAAVRCYAATFYAVPGATSVGVGWVGHYVDELERRGGAWEVVAHRALPAEGTRRWDYARV